METKYRTKPQPKPFSVCLISSFPKANALVRTLPESVENIWNTLDESIQAQAEKVLKQAQKVSTGCGGTPPREIAAVEMGTSPPPQSISTQVNNRYKGSFKDGLYTPIPSRPTTPCPSARSRKRSQLWFPIALEPRSPVRWSHVLTTGVTLS